MGKLQDAHVFSQEKGAIAKFFVFLAIYASAMFTSHLFVSLVEHQPVKCWESLLVLLILATVVTADYFIARLLAYRTKIFPKTENREGLHGVSFIFLLVISVIVALLIA
ncbi:MAG: hypothetical protein IJ622_00495 [Bacteroidales bacterium]|nr:hypothetical protein [Bacteroidales bacterium]